MKAAIGSVVVAAALIVAGQVPMRAAAPQTTSTTTSTKSTSPESRIEKRLHDSSLKKYDIKVSVNNGVATLTGTVPTEADRRKAAELATIDGISRVDNQLIVDISAGTAKGTAGAVEKGAEKTKSGVGKAVDKSSEGVGKATEKTKEGAEKTGEVVTDGYIKTRVHSKFVDEDLLKGSDITVDVKDHVVTLTGTVATQAGRARAVEQAKEVEGVHRVVDKLTIGPKK